jgi:hypothetical protein
MNFKKIALLGSLLAGTAVPTLPVTSFIRRLALPISRHLNTVGSSATSGLGKQLPASLIQPSRSSRLLAGAGAATATAALLSQQPAELDAAERVVVNVYTTPKGFKKRIIIIQRNGSKAQPEIQDMVDKHNTQTSIITEKLTNTLSPSYLLIEADEAEVEEVSRELKAGRKPENLVEAAILGSQISNGNKPQTIFFDKRDSQDSYLLKLVLSPDKELLEAHQIPAEQRAAVLKKEFSKCAEKNNRWAEARIRAANLPKNPPVQAYVAACVSDTYRDNASLQEAAYATAHTATVAHVLCEVFEKITLKQENNTIVVVANRFVAQQVQKALDNTNNDLPTAKQPLKIFAHFQASDPSGQDCFVKEDFGALVAEWIQRHEDAFDGKTQK